MSMTSNSIGPKTHPASREMLPDDPLEFTAIELDGDPRLMLRVLVEEYARMGWGAEQILQMAANPFYVGVHGLLRAFGPDRLRQEINSIIDRCGIMSTNVRETAPEPEPHEPQVVQLELKRGENRHTTVLDGMPAGASTNNSNR